jgi:hypothetical protein
MQVLLCRSELADLAGHSLVRLVLQSMQYTWPSFVPSHGLGMRLPVSTTWPVKSSWSYQTSFINTLYMYMYAFCSVTLSRGNPFKSGKGLIITTSHILPPMTLCKGVVYSVVGSHNHRWVIDALWHTVGEGHCEYAKRAVLFVSACFSNMLHCSLQVCHWDWHFLSLSGFTPITGPVGISPFSLTSSWCCHQNWCSFSTLGDFKTAL